MAQRLEPPAGDGAKPDDCPTCDGGKLSAVAAVHGRDGTGQMLVSIPLVVPGESTGIPPGIPLALT